MMKTSIRYYFQNRKKETLDEWFKTMVVLFNNGTDFFNNEDDHFLNPVRSIIVPTIKFIFSYLFEEIDINEFTESLEKFAKLLALKGPKAREALGPLLLFKEKVIKDIVLLDSTHIELFEITGRFDNLILIIFDLFVQSREKIYEIRVNEVKRLTYSLLKNKDLIEKIPTFDCDGKKKAYEF